jgi:transposase InsO family protein
MTANDNRASTALTAIAQRHGRPGTPTDQAHVESLFGHLKGDRPHLERLTTPAPWTRSSPASAAPTTPSGSTPRSATSPPTTSTNGRGPPTRRARAAGMARARAARIKENRRRRR